MMTAKEKEEKIILYMNKLDLSREEAEQLIEAVIRTAGWLTLCAGLRK